MSSLPYSLIASFIVFSFFLFYQQLHVKNFQGASQTFGLILNVFAFSAMIYGYGFLIYWGYSVSWLHAVILFVAGLLLKLVWFPVEAKLGLRNSFLILSLVGFVVIPLSGYFMFRALP
jgi:hypothetical protein